MSGSSQIQSLSIEMSESFLFGLYFVDGGVQGAIKYGLALVILRLIILLTF